MFCNFVNILFANDYSVVLRVVLFNFYFFKNGLEKLFYRFALVIANFQNQNTFVRQMVFYIMRQNSVKVKAVFASVKILVRNF